MGTPSTPTRLTAIVILPTEIDFAWSSLGENTQQYLIERSLNGSTWEQIATTPVSQTLYRNTGLSGSTTYYYRVRATDWVAYSSYSPVLTVTTLSTGIAGRLARWLDTLHTGNASLVDAITGAIGTLAAALTGNRVWTFPDKDGTVAMTSDIPATHDAVTLGADAGALLGLTGQQITLDAMAAHAFLAGPTSGGPADPTARAIVASDIGTGTPDGTKFLRDDMSWQPIQSGGGEVLMASGVTPPEPIVSSDGTDWLYSS